MKRLAVFCIVVLASAAASAQWQTVVPGVDYAHFVDGAMDIHVARIDMTDPKVKIVASRESDAGSRVSDFAKRTHAVVAINGDYFEKDFRPVGLVVGACGQWTDSKDTSREGVVAFGTGRVEIHAQAEVMDPPDSWIAAAVSGWPMIVRDCHALTSAELPGSDSFTRSPHARTAVGESKDGTMVYFVVVNAPGVTLGQLAAWMSDRLGVCAAMNLDGGGSTAMWVGDRIVNKPADGTERPVGDHLAVVSADEQISCDLQNAKATITLTTPAPQTTTSPHQ